MPDPRCPLEPREGISPRKVMLEGIVPAAPAYFAGRAGDSPFEFGARIPPGTFLAKPVLAWFHPDVPPEPPIPFDYQLVGEAAGLVLVDKPGFLPSTSNGRIVRETVQTRLRRRLQNPDVVPVHRLDRLTSGLLACSTQRESRAWYQQQFADRTARKTYRAQLIDAPPFGTEWTVVELPMRRKASARGVEVTAGGTRTRTRVRLIRDRLVELQPLTGFTHQLRVLCAHVGAPIVGDDTYPVDIGLQLDNYSVTMKLCATHLELREWGSGARKMWSSPRLAEAGFWAAG